MEKNLSEWFFLLREGLGLTQQAVAERVKSNRSTIAKFELEQVNLSEDVLLKLSDELKISRDFVMGKSDYPFIPSHFYKLYTAGRGTKKLDLLYKLPFVCQGFYAVAIIPSLSAFMKWLRLRSIRSTVYAIAVKDSHGTIFLLRDKNPNSFIRVSEYLFEEMEQTFQAVKAEGGDTANYVFSMVHVGKVAGFDVDLFEKIKNWTASKSDIDKLVENPPRVLELTASEERLIKMLRKKKISPNNLIRQLDKTRDSERSAPKKLEFESDLPDIRPPDQQLK